MRIRRPVAEAIELDDEEDFEEELDEAEIEEIVPHKLHILRDKERPPYESEKLPPLVKYQPELKQKAQRPWMREARVYMRAFLAEGLTRAEIMDRMGIDDKIYDKLEYQLMESDGAKFIQMGTAQRYYVHTLRMEQLVRELDQFVRTHMKDDPRKSGVVGAIKAKAQIYKDLIVMGQDLGIIDKRAKELRVLGEINLGALPNEELRELLETRFQWFQNVMSPPKKLSSAYDGILERSVEQIDNGEIVDAEWEESPQEEEAADYQD